MKKSKYLPYIEGAVVIALAVILSYVRIYRFPWGGSVTLLSMLPVSMYSIKYGVSKGLVVSGVFALFQFFQGITDGLFGWGLTPMMLVGCILLDYLLAYTMIGISGIFRKKGALGWIAGTVIALTMRFCCHFLSGVVIFKSVDKLWDGFDTDSFYLYSLLYNGCYMLPEIIITCIGAYVMFRIPVIKKLITGGSEK